MLAATTLALLALPASASAVPDASISNYEYGWCCSGDSQTVENLFKGHEFEVQNIGDTPLELDTLRVTFDPTSLAWSTGLDGDGVASLLTVGHNDAMMTWVSAVDVSPLSDDPTACIEESAAPTQVTYACDLGGAEVPVGLTGWVSLKSLLPANGFSYGNTTVSYELSFIDDLVAPHNHSEDFQFIAGESNLQAMGGYLGDPDLLDHNWPGGDYRDLDGESTGISYAAGDVVPFRIAFENPAHETDPTSVAHGITIDFNIPTDSVNDWETEFLGDGEVDVTGGLSNPVCIMQFDGGSNQDWRCTFDGHVAVDGTATVTIPIRFVDGLDIQMLFDVETANGTIGMFTDPEEMTYGSEDQCELPRFFGATSPTGGPDESSRYRMVGAASIADLEAGDPIRYQLPCWEPEATPLTNFSSTFGSWSPATGYSNPGAHIGVFRGPANASYGWLSNEAVAPGPNGEYAFTWEAAGLANLTAGDVLDSARIAARPAIGGDYYRIVFHVAVEERADLSATLTGPTSLEVAPGGSEATYTATVSNAGPDTATSSRVKVQLPTAATHVSSTGGTGSDACSAAGQLVTCTVANLASGDARTFTIVTRYEAGVGGLALPAIPSVTATAELLGSGTADPDATDDVDDAVTSLTAAPTCSAGQTGTPPNCVTPTTPTCAEGQTGTPPNCVTPTTPTCAEGQTGTPPNCVTPKTVIGGTKDETFSGSDGGDTFTGGTGNETFFAGPGGDTADGGGGNDRLFGSRGDDRFTGGIGNDRLFGGAGDDFLRGGAGNDHVHGGGGTDDVRGGTGDDQVSCGAGPREQAFGDGGNDVVSCLDRARADTVNGGAGNRDLCIGDAGDTFVGCERILRIALPKF